MSTLTTLAAAAIGGSIPGSIQWFVSTRGRTRDLRIACRLADEELLRASLLVAAALEFQSIDADDILELRSLELSEPMTVIRGEFDDALWKGMRRARGALWVAAMAKPGPVSLDSAAFLAARDQVEEARDLLGMRV